jgi:uncharacterized protein YndB with AHSA1/START domain
MAPRSRTAAEPVTLTRVFDAPVDTVWRAWTDPGPFSRWWGPKNFTGGSSAMDVRVGGRLHHVMRAPDGKEYWSTGVYREVVPKERLVFTDAFADADGNPVPASYYGLKGNWPPELLVTLTFQEEDGKTSMTLTHEGFPEGDEAMMAEVGWSQSLDKLAASLKQ